MANSEFHDLNIDVDGPLGIRISVDGKELKGVTGIRLDWTPENLVQAEVKMIVGGGKLEFEQLRMMSARTTLDVEKKEPVKEFTWVAVLDDQTCAHCAYMDGKTVKEDSGIKPPLPQCVNEKGEGKCRCVLVEKK